MAKIGDKIRIVNMESTSLYNGLEGEVEDINFYGFLKGTWGDIGVDPSEDEIEVITDLVGFVS